MSIKISVDYEKALAGITKIKEKMKPEIIDKSLDSRLTLDLANLKEKLLVMLNNDQKSVLEVKNQNLTDTQIKVRKSDEELIKHLTGVDLTKVSKTKDYNTLADGKLAVISNRVTDGASKIDQLNGAPTSRMSSGVNLRLPIGEADSFESQYNQALNYYNNAVFVFIDNNGKANYYVNPGIDMSRFVKVVCSREAGNTVKSSDKWDSHRDKRGFADWTLLKEGLDVIKRDFINITDVIEKLKEGDYDEAKHIYSRVGKNNTQSNEIFNKIDDLKQKKDLSPTVESYNNIVKLIRNLKLEKTIKEDSTFYTLVSTYDETVKDYANFQDKIKEEADLWQISNEQDWIKTLVDSIVDLAEKSLR
jgi:tetratricopeptide (TPR) repeat protein